MNKDKDYYSILGVKSDSTEKEIRSSYYKLSFVHHPDKGGEQSIFNEITEAYTILYDSVTREEYDMKSQYGKNYNEYFELFNIKVDYSYDYEKERLEAFKRNDVLNIVVEIDSDFKGSVEYDRWVKCKTCDGTGKDLTSKIVIKDNDGNVLRTFDADDGCDFCEGSGKDYNGNPCSFCFGKGKLGLNQCKTCNGDKRIMGRQKLKGIKLTGDETKIDAMGHFSKDEPGKAGYLLLLRK